MRPFLLFTLPMLAIVITGVVFYALLQTRMHDQRASDDLRRRVKAITESTEVIAGHILRNGDSVIAARLTRSFEKRERFQGYALYDSSGRVIAITDRIRDFQFERDYVSRVVREGVPHEHYETAGGKQFLGYAMPVFDDDRVVGVAEVLYESTKPAEQQTAFWKRLSIFLIALSVTLVLLTLSLHHRIFILPVRNITGWFHSYLKGETKALHPSFSDGHLGKFASEVEQLALSLRVARRNIAQTASVQLLKEELWTEDRLKHLVQARLGENSLVVVSNREPLMHKFDKATMTTRTITPAGGVVTAIHPILEACGGTWIAHGSGDQDKKFVNSKDKLGIPPEDARYILKRIWLTKEEEQGYYYGFSNEGLWPLCHNTHTRPVFRESDWQMYCMVNRKFADAICDELPSQNAFVFIQDYHFTLLAKYIREKRPDAHIALFWHIPWPNPEAFSICPYHGEILDGLLGCDLLGFHLQNHCNNFLDTANRLLESRVDTENHSIMRNGKETFVRPFPISIDSVDTADEAENHRRHRQAAERIRKELNLGDSLVGIGVDRLDYTKGILERFLAIERFLEKYPEYVGRFTFIQIGSPSRTHIRAYHQFVSEVDAAAERINWKFSEGNWSPIIYLKKHFDSAEIVPYYMMADTCIVSSLHDGMNLVAKEYVHAKKDDEGALILSQFAGSSKELTDAIVINPYSIEDFADAIRLSVEMPASEKKRRMSAMRLSVRENNVFKWAGNIITELTAIAARKNPVLRNEAGVPLATIN